MLSQWSDAAAERLVERYAIDGVSGDLALRVYTSRLLGGDPKLVLHGGGNTSVKTIVKDLLGEEAEVLCVKGSGWDMAAIEPAGLPAVRVAPLRKLRARESLSDEEMVRVQRANLIDPNAPNPSVETLLHAFLPHKFVDHTHSTAVLSLADQPDAAERCADLYGGRLGLVPYIMPGFLLAKAAAEMFEADPTVEGLVLLKHGIFTFGDSAQQAYERMVAAVSRAEQQLTQRRKTVFAVASLPAAIASAAEVAPILRGACAIPSPTEAGAYKRFLFDFRTGAAVLELCQRRRARPLWPGRRCHSRPHDPHQELSADRAAAAGRPARWLQACGARGGRRVSPATTMPISPVTMRARRYRNANSIRCRGSSWCRGSASSALAAMRRMRGSLPTSPYRRSRP